MLARLWTLLALQVMLGTGQETVDCEEEPDNMLCCPLEPGRTCLLQGFFKPHYPCSAACKKRYQSLGWECYKDYKENFMWQNMAKNCDSQGLIEFKPPTTSFRPNYGGAVISSSSAAPAVAHLWPVWATMLVAFMMPGRA
eukprot:TRINITY_DN77820_c0_g1_i1.p1 TRINITY_DN77820_c0_g1~~TRINITY_DN77820_c0_g1_i1.p1  ORF type:complete len:140 (+),score=30.63 TRINITY_DN77820_c0_g1_i1:79-498(+)